MSEIFSNLIQVLRARVVARCSFMFLYVEPLGDYFISRRFAPQHPQT